ncbi:conserved hypothetical protein [Capnocytophaga canimorsus]|nr:hypothetical protein [Capnocytophaga canimorsus]CEN50681.1 conserved hypothetical protein [Capnocytophaga canimorsus]
MFFSYVELVNSLVATLVIGQTNTRGSIRRKVLAYSNELTETFETFLTLYIMRFNFFSRWFAIGVIAAALVMIGCSKDDKNDEPKLNNAVRIDGETKPIIGARINESELADNNYDMFIYLSEKEGFVIQVAKQHHEGQTIDLTKKEPKRDGGYWYVGYYKPGEIIFGTYADPNKQSYPVFQSGTLYVKRLADVDGQPVFEIELKNGQVKGEGDYGAGQEPTIRLHYKGKLELFKEDNTIKDNAVMIDGETKPIVGAKIDEDRLAKNNYNMYIYLSESEYVRIIGSNQHHEGQTIDLIKKEPKRDGGYWSVEYAKSGKIIFDTYSRPDRYHPVFQSGTLYVKRLADADGQPVFEIELKNGKVKGEGDYGDGKEHTISFHYKGKLELFKEDNTIKDNAVMIDGETKPIVGAKIDEDCLAKNNYNMYIYLSESEYVRIMATKEYHEGKIIDLTKKELEHEGWYWSVEYYESGETILDTFADPDQQNYPVFQSGTLYIKRLDDANGQPVFEIKLENGKVKGEEEYGDGKEHTIRLYYAGKLELL